VVVMKRVKVTFILPDIYGKEDIAKHMLAGCEMESYEEKMVPKESDILTEHSFDSLMEGMFEFANGLWLVVKGFWKMSAFAVVMIVEGLRWLWGKGIDSKKQNRKK
jgi:hypothetical protein